MVELGAAFADLVPGVGAAVEQVAALLEGVFGLVPQAVQACTHHLAGALDDVAEAAQDLAGPLRDVAGTSPAMRFAAARGYRLGSVVARSGACWLLLGASLWAWTCWLWPLAVEVIGSIRPAEVLTPASPKNGVVGRLIWASMAVVSISTTSAGLRPVSIAVPAPAVACGNGADGNSGSPPGIVSSADSESGWSVGTARAPGSGTAAS